MRRIVAVQRIMTCVGEGESRKGGGVQYFPPMIVDARLLKSDDVAAGFWALPSEAKRLRRLLLHATTPQRP